MKKILKVIGVCLIALVSVFALVGCGESAYELALKNGYQGTESEWLESLKGKNGQNGENGVNYQDIRNLYNDLFANGEYTGSFLDFIKDYIKVYDVGSMDLVANHALLSAVSITASYGMYANAGSGVIYEIDSENENVYIVTNFHVVYIEDANKIASTIKINLYGKEGSDSAITCRYLGGSEAYDVAVLQVEGSGARTIIDGDYEEVEIAEYNDITPAERIIAVGNAMGEGITVVTGSVSVDSRFIAYYISNSRAYYHRAFQYDAQINSGNSGGGIYNSDGKLIGIVNARHLSSFDYSSIEVVEGMCYGVPIVNVDCIYKYIRSKYTGTALSIKTYDFGMQCVVANSTAYYDTTEHKTKITMDVSISEVQNSGLAYRAGLKVGDLIQRVKITKTTDEVFEMEITRDFMLDDILMFANTVGDNIEFKIKRYVENTTDFEILTKSVITTSFDSSSLKTLENLAISV